jgi:hypothetical protein
MSASEPRSRIVVFRLTEAEYRDLKAACREHGGRSLSEFTRSEMLEALRAETLGELVERRLDTFDNRLAELTVRVESISRLLEQMRSPAAEEQR